MKSADFIVRLSSALVVLYSEAYLVLFVNLSAVSSFVFTFLSVLGSWQHIKHVHITSERVIAYQRHLCLD